MGHPLPWGNDRKKSKDNDQKQGNDKSKSKDIDKSKKQRQLEWA
jgi:hypothetical protein